LLQEFSMKVSTFRSRWRHPNATDPVLGHRAVVLGGGLTGLLAAGVLAHRFDQVVIVERDDVLAGAGGARRGVPQARHSHGLLVGGSRAMERLQPGLTAELVARGAVSDDVTARLRWWISGFEQTRFDSGLIGVLASRPGIEGAIRRRLLRLPNIVLIGGYDITGLVVSSDRRRVLGARLAANNTASKSSTVSEPGGATGSGLRRRSPIEDADRSTREDRVISAGGLASKSSTVIESGAVLADLVVDATGRGSQAAVWLTELGYPPVRENLVEAGMTYVTRHFRQQPGVLDELDGEVVGTAPDGYRSGVALRQEDGTWTVTIVGAFGERPPRELDEFRSYASSLPMPGVAAVAAGCEPVDEPRTYHYPNSRWLRWDKVADRPDRFLVIGDAVCSFNPVYGQGMSAAALQVEVLAEALDGGLADLPARAAKGFAGVIATPWTVATGSDRRHVSQPAKSLPERLLDRYQDRLLAVARHDQDVALAFHRVLNLLAAPPSLLAPRIAARVLRPGRARSASSVPVGRVAA